jgi:beta-alanine degradation protein BauB
MQKMLIAGLLVAAHAIAQDPMLVDPAHYTVAFENQWVRALLVHYPPGEGSPMHEHSAGVRVFLTDIHNRFHNENGTVTEASRRAGTVAWAEKVRHANSNLTQSTVRIVELELKQPPPASPAPGKATAIDPLEKVLIDNPAVRVVRAEIPAQAETHMHTHPGSVVIDSTPEHSGAVTWLPAGAHLVKNPGPETLVLVIVELKPGG